MNLLELLGPGTAPSAEAAYEAALIAVLLDHHRRAGGSAATTAMLATSIARLCAAQRRGAASCRLADADEQAALRSSPIVSTPEGPRQPLVLVGETLYTDRHWQLRQTWYAVLGRLHRPRPPRNAAAMQALLDTLFPPRAEGAADGQRQAAFLAATRGLALLAGGPGTGKTTTVVRLLALLLNDDPGLTVALAAPTGKAAARMSEAIQQQLARLPVSPALQARLPTQAQTLHRLLGARGEGAGFRHGPDHRLPADVVIVDESSMLDAALAAQLGSALQDDARLVLLGDPHQLSAVEAGPVFADLVSDAALVTSPWRAAVVTLQGSRRYAANGALGALANACLAGDVAGSLAALQVFGGPRPSPPEATSLLAGYTEWLTALQQASTTPQALLAAFDRHRVLAATHRGRGGTRQLNAALTALVQAGVPASRDSQGPWFHGRPVLVRQNDAARALFNGDIGLALRDEDGALRVHFPAADGGTRAYVPAQLPAVETAFAITVHQAQGSEFDSVDVVIDPDYALNASRALVYTAVTRARKSVRVFATEATLATALRSG